MAVCGCERGEQPDAIDMSKTEVLKKRQPAKLYQLSLAGFANKGGVRAEL